MKREDLERMIQEKVRLEVSLLMPEMLRRILNEAMEGTMKKYLAEMKQAVQVEAPKMVRQPGPLNEATRQALREKLRSRIWAEGEPGVIGSIPDLPMVQEDVAVADSSDANELLPGYMMGVHQETGEPIPIPVRTKEAQAVVKNLTRNYSDIMKRIIKN
jgi:hypothetical protein